MEFTIFGSQGFIGSNTLKSLKNQGIDCNTPDIDDQKIFDKPLGHVIYAIGITSDFRERPLDTVESHVCLLHDLFKKSQFDSFLYLSSTRIYSGLSSTDEGNSLLVNPTRFGDIYNISKIMGESLCMACNNKNVKIVRLSNVIGNNFDSNDFLFSIIRDAVTAKKVILHTTPESEKDYVHVDDVVKMLPEISLHGKYKIYNIASGKNIKVSEIMDEIKKLTNCDIHFAPDAQYQSFPEINIQRIKKEFNFEPKQLLTILNDLVLQYEKKQ